MFPAQLKLRLKFRNGSGTAEFKDMGDVAKRNYRKLYVYSFLQKLEKLDFIYDSDFSIFRGTSSVSELYRNAFVNVVYPIFLRTIDKKICLEYNINKNLFSRNMFEYFNYAGKHHPSVLLETEFKEHSHNFNRIMKNIIAKNEINKTSTI